MKTRRRNILNAAVAFIAALIMLLSGTVMSANLDDKEISIIESEAEINNEELMDDVWIHFDNSIIAGGIGLCDTFEAAIRITPEELEDYDNWQLTVVGFYGWTNSLISGNIKIYEAGTSITPGPLITSEPYTVNGTDWFEIPLSSPVLLDADEDVWVSVEVNSCPGELCFDTGPAVDGKGNWIYFDGEWKELQEWCIDANWIIRAKVEPGGPIIKLELLNDQWSWPTFDVAIKNIGDADATDVSWYILVDGLFFGLLTKNTSGQISIIPANAEDDVIIRSGIIFGLGPTTITIFAICAEGSWDKIVIEGKLFLFFFHNTS